MIEALAHDLGKVTPARFDDHAAASVELLRRADFDDEAVLNLILNRGGGKRYSLNMSLAPKHSFREASYKLPSDEKMKDAIIKKHSEGFEVEGIAYQTCLPELHVKEVIEGETV